MQFDELIAHGGRLRPTTLLLELPARFSSA
jgi:hypothetical protein